MSRKKKFLCMAIYLWALLLMTGLLHNLIYRNRSISEPIGYYLSLPLFPLHRESLVLLCIMDEKYKQILLDLGLPDTSNECPNGLPYLLKKIKAINGDTIEIVNNGVTINGMLQPNSWQYSEAHGIKLYPLPLGYKHTLTENEYFMLGNSPHSVDSRYFGVIKETDIYRKAVLVYKTAE